MMHKDRELERMADMLLRQANAARDPDYPAYPDHYLAARDRRRAGELSLEEMFQLTTRELRGIDELFDVAWTEIRSGAAKAGCSSLQIQCLELRRFGISYGDISRLLGVPPVTVYRELQTAKKQLENIDAFGLWTVLAEVFKVDVEKIKSVILRRGKKKLE